MSTMDLPRDLDELARTVIDTNHYLVLGTVDDELPQACAEVFTHVGEGAKAFQPHELSGQAALRLYRAHATNLDVHIPGRDPAYGTGIDKRRAVNP